LVFHPDFANESQKAIDQLSTVRIGNTGSLSIVQEDNEYAGVPEKSIQKLTIDVLVRAWRFQVKCYRILSKEEDSQLMEEDVDRLEEAFEFLQEKFQKDKSRDEN
jgi:hypothetical protein